MDPSLIRELKRLRQREGDPDTLPLLKPRFVKKKDRHGYGNDAGNGIEGLSVASSVSMVTDTGCTMAPNPATLSERERKMVRERYLGERDENSRSGRRHRRTGDRKVNFDWDADDDTSVDMSSLEDSLRRPPPRHAKSRTVVRTVDEFGNEIEKMSTVAPTGERGLHRSTIDDRNWREKELEEMQERDWRILKEDFGISTSGGNMPPPLRYWEEAPFPSVLKDIIQDIGYKQPTPIQRQSIPVIISGRDSIGIAETGSGKTAAFILPIICLILKLPQLSESNMLDGPYALILAPTRELAQQIEHETKKFCSPLGLRCASIVGGHSIAEQSINMRKGVEIVIATPGRLRDCLEQHVLALNQCFCIVLDEADRMIDLNFEEDLHFILDCLPPTMRKPDSEMAENPARFMSHGKYRQLTMFSATMPPPVEKLARKFLQRPGTVNVGHSDKAADTVEQRIVLLKEEQKDREFLNILDSAEFAAPIIVFVNQKRTVDYLARRLETLGHRCIALHGGKNQEQREHAIAQLKRGTSDLLIATDVAGRGIDIPNVSLVLNYDMAKSVEDYIHRIGRTGRMGRSGTAITFLTADDADLYFDLRVLVQKAPKSTIPPEFLSHEASRVRPGTVVQKKRHEERIYAYGV